MVSKLPMNGNDKKNVTVKFEGSSEIKKPEPEKIELSVDKEALKKFKLIAVAYSHVERAWFPNNLPHSRHLS